MEYDYREQINFFRKYKEILSGVPREMRGQVLRVAYRLEVLHGERNMKSLAITLMPRELRDQLRELLITRPSEAVARLEEAMGKVASSRRS